VQIDSDRLEWHRRGRDASESRSTVSLRFVASAIVSDPGVVLKDGPVPLRRNRPSPERVVRSCREPMANASSIGSQASPCSRADRASVPTIRSVPAPGQEGKRYATVLAAARPNG
jgi:hypothetical protein